MIRHRCGSLPHYERRRCKRKKSVEIKILPDDTRASPDDDVSRTSGTGTCTYLRDGVYINIRILDYRYSPSRSKKKTRTPSSALWIRLASSQRFVRIDPVVGEIGVHRVFSSSIASRARPNLRSIP